MNRFRTVVVSLLVAAAASYFTWSAISAKSVSGIAPRERYTTPGHIVMNRIDDIKVGDPQTYKGLTVIPLTGPSLGGLRYLTLDDAMRRGVLIVSEKGSGEVNAVNIRNKSDYRVFIMDGEEIVGAKQNRILNSSVMIPNTNETVSIPVSCVEHGRWVAESQQFKSGNTQLFARARQSNVAAVNKNYSAAPTAGPQSDQAMIWNDVAAKRSALSIPNASGPMHEAYSKYDTSIGDYVKAFRVVPGQVGAVFAIDGEIIGADIFDQHDTLDALFPKLVKSYALDAIESRSSKPASVSKDRAQEFVRRALGKDVKVSDYSSPGEGRDVRISGKTINGSSLVYGLRAVHIALFAPANVKPVSTMRNTPEPGPIRPANQRRDVFRNR